MAKKTRHVYVVSRSSVFNDSPDGMEAIFDTHEAAEAYIQFRIDLERSKHKQGHGGRWFNRAVHDEAVINCGCDDYYSLSIEKSKVYTKDDVINSRMK